MTEFQGRDAELPELSSSDPSQSRQRLSRRRFLTGAAATGLAALGAIDSVEAAMQEARAEPTWLHAALTQGEGNQWIVSCVGPGKTCAVLRLVTAKRVTPFHDANLVKCTAGVNALLDEIRTGNSDPSRHACFIVTPYAPFLAWSRSVPDLRFESAITLTAAPDRFYQTAGIALGALRQKPIRFWYCIGGSAVGCKKGGDTQIVAQCLKAERPSLIHDARLAEYTDRINALLTSYDRNNRNPTRRLCLLVTPKGLFLAWSTDDDREGPPPRGAVTAEASDDRVFEALGI